MRISDWSSDVCSSDLFQLADFFDRQGITIESLHCSRYRAMQTGADMFSAQVTIGVPADMHIAALRDDFLEFCDHLNLDAIMDPMKFCLENAYGIFRLRARSDRLSAGG